MLNRRKFIGLAIMAVGVTASGIIMSTYLSAMGQVSATLASQQSQLVETRFGTLEYGDVGDGPPILMIHGTGGGFDQGLYFFKKLSSQGYRVIAPSRFGYLRSTMPADPSPENQADAYIDLIDALGVEKIVVAGGSAGALSALQFAIRHPERCAALLPIVPATFAPNRPAARPWSPVQKFVAQSVLKSDFLFWAGLTTMQNRVTQILLATDISLVAAASVEEKARVKEILWSILPVSEKVEGLLWDARYSGNPQSMPLEKITAPTLTISLEDDRFLTVDAARHIASTVPGAHLIVYPTGGHVWVGHDTEIFDAIRKFLNSIGYV